MLPNRNIRGNVAARHYFSNVASRCELIYLKCNLANKINKLQLIKIWIWYENRVKRHQKLTRSTPLSPEDI